VLVVFTRVHAQFTVLLHEVNTCPDILMCCHHHDSEVHYNMYDLSEFTAADLHTLMQRRHDPTHSDTTSDQGLRDTSRRRADLVALRLLLPENVVPLSLQQCSPSGSGSPETAHGEQ
jgi:hypothetical protein